MKGRIHKGMDRHGMPNTAKIFGTPGQRRREARFNKAYQRMKRSQASDISKRRAPMYAYCAFALAAYKDGHRIAWIQRRIAAAQEIWQSYLPDEQKMVDDVKAIGIDIQAITGLYESDDLDNISEYAVKNFREACDVAHFSFASILLAMKNIDGWGKMRMDRMMTHMWKWWMFTMSDPDRSIMQVCKDETGIDFEMME